MDNIAQFIVQTRFVCQFNIEGRVTSVTAQLLSDTIYCDNLDFTYNARCVCVCVVVVCASYRVPVIQKTLNTHFNVFRVLVHGLFLHQGL